MNQTELPSPIYAAAGAGELAYQKLRRLPETATRTMRSAGQTAEELRHRFAARELDLPAEWTRVRESAQRGTATVVARAAEAQERAVAGYRRLVAHGERVMADRVGVATGHADPAGIEVEVGPVRSSERRGRSRPEAETRPETETPSPDGPSQAGPSPDNPDREDSGAPANPA